MQANVPTDYLPDESTPDFFYALPELHYPRQLNTTYEMVDRHVEAGHGDRPAIIFEGETLSYANLQSQVDRAANALLDLGVEPGDRVFVRFPNRPEYVVSCLATQKIGAITVPSMKLLRAKEIGYIINDSEARVAIVYDELLDEVQDAVDEQSLESLEEIVVVEATGVDHEHHSFDALLEAAGDAPVAAETHRDDLAMIAYTSGTTGQPKGCVHSHRRILATTDAYARYCLDSRPADVFTSNAPIAFTFGYGLLIAFPLRFGATTCIIQNPTPQLLLDAIDQHDVSVLASVPTAYNQMFSEHADLIDAYDLESLRCCVSAGEPLPPKTFDDIKTHFGVEALDGIGSTEMWHIFISHRHDDDIDPTATGKPVPGYECKVVDPESQEELPRGEPGLLLIRGPTGITYWNKPDEQAGAVFDGWSHPGDMFIHREDGRFEYVSRSDDMIITGGHNVPGPEVEDVLLERDEVFQAAVIGSPDPERGQIVKAYVIPAEGVEADASLTQSLQDYVKEEIAPYKYPREIKYVDELPTTETGKIQRAVLREWEQGV